MIEFLGSVPWWGWSLLVVWFFFVVFRMQMQYIKGMSPADLDKWLKEQEQKKPWYMK